MNKITIQGGQWWSHITSIEIIGKSKFMDNVTKVWLDEKASILQFQLPRCKSGGPAVQLTALLSTTRSPWCSMARGERGGKVSLATWRTTSCPLPSLPTSAWGPANSNSGRHSDGNEPSLAADNDLIAHSLFTLLLTRFIFPWPFHCAWIQKAGSNPTKSATTLWEKYWKTCVMDEKP